MCIGYFSRIHVAIKLNVGQRKTKTRGGGGGEGASIYTNGKIYSNVEELKIVVNKRTNK